MIALYNPYFIGDTVLLEPIATQLKQLMDDDIYIISNYSELLEGHPTIKGAGAVDKNDPNLIIVNFARSLRSLEDVKKERSGIKKLILKAIPTLKDNPLFSDKYMKIVPNKIKNMYFTAGLDPDRTQQPRLYLRPEEEESSRQLSKLFHKARIGVMLTSRHKNKNYPYTKLLINQLVNYGHDVFVICEKLEPEYSYIKKLKVYLLEGLSFRELMTWLSILDVMVGPDTGPMHIAGALNVPLVVMTRHDWRDLYDIYPKSEVICNVPGVSPDLRTIPVSRVLESVKKQLGNKKWDIAPYIKTTKSDIVLFRLDGLGGSITLTDHATKIYNKTGIKSTLVVRSNKDIFLDHPHIKKVIEVGYVNWGESLNEILKEFNTVAEIRFGLGKWHQLGKKIFDQDFKQLQGIFDEFPRNYNKLEIHGLHHVQLTDKTLGLPFDSIESKLYHFADTRQFELPKDYILLNNGVDMQHQGMKQTKTWDYWNELVSLLDLPTVQIGTQYDQRINSKTIDLRNKTSMGQLSELVKNAKAMICTEGGLMHLSYAVDSPNVFVLRGPTRGKLFEYPGHHFIDSYICNNCWSTTDDWYINCPRNCDAVCMQSITPERVAYNIGALLRNENMV